MSNTDHGHVRRRQNTAGNYIDGNGAATASCLASPTYFINNLGQLSTPDGRVISASKDAGFSRFVPSTTVSDISTTWKLSGSTLSFHNGTFLNGIATLCLNIVSDQVEMYYFAVPRPTCSMIALTIAPLSACPGVDQLSSNTVLPISTFPSNSTVLSSSTSLPNTGSLIVSSILSSYLTDTPSGKVTIPSAAASFSSVVSSRTTSTLALTSGGPSSALGTSSYSYLAPDVSSLTSTSSMTPALNSISLPAETPPYIGPSTAFPLESSSSVGSILSPTSTFLQSSSSLAVNSTPRFSSNTFLFSILSSAINISSTRATSLSLNLSTLSSATLAVNISSFLTNTLSSLSSSFSASTSLAIGQVSSFHSIFSGCPCSNWDVSTSENTRERLLHPETSPAANSHPSYSTIFDEGNKRRAIKMANLKPRSATSTSEGVSLAKFNDRIMTDATDLTTTVAELKPTPITTSDAQPTDDPDEQPVDDSDETSTITETIQSGTSYYTTKVVEDGAQTVVEVVLPTPSVPGLTYRAFIIPDDQSTNLEANATYFNSNPNSIFARTTLDANFQTCCGAYDVGEPQGMFNTTRKALLYQGYFRAPETADFDPFTVSRSLTSYIWTGEKAFSLWTQDNYDCLDISGGEIRSKDCGALGELHIGQTVPITILWMNFNGYNVAREVDFELGVSSQKKKKRDTAGDFSLFLLPTTPDRLTYPIQYFAYTG